MNSLPRTTLLGATAATAPFGFVSGRLRRSRYHASSSSTAGGKSNPSKQCHDITSRLTEHASCGQLNHLSSRARQEAVRARVGGARARATSPPTTPPAMAPALELPPPGDAGAPLPLPLSGDEVPPPAGVPGVDAEGPGAPDSGAGVGGDPGVPWGTTDTMTVCAGSPSLLSTWPGSETPLGCGRGLCNLRLPLLPAASTDAWKRIRSSHFGTRIIVSMADQGDRYTCGDRAHGCSRTAAGCHSTTSRAWHQGWG